MKATLLVEITNNLEDDITSRLARIHETCRLMDILTSKNWHATIEKVTITTEFIARIEHPDELDALPEYP